MGKFEFYDDNDDIEVPAIAGFEDPTPGANIQFVSQKAQNKSPEKSRAAPAQQRQESTSQRPGAQQMSGSVAPQQATASEFPAATSSVNSGEAASMDHVPTTQSSTSPGDDSSKDTMTTSTTGIPIPAVIEDTSKNSSTSSAGIAIPAVSNPSADVANTQTSKAVVGDASIHTNDSTATGEENEVTAHAPAATGKEDEVTTPAGTDNAGG
ncbi:hypothetical protein K435DRAFT_864910, partial [Dendrothele bispora CBS 962.96]